MGGYLLLAGEINDESRCYRGDISLPHEFGSRPVLVAPST